MEIGGAERSIAGNIPLHVSNGFNMDVLLLNGEKTFFKEELLKNNIKVYALGVNNNIFNPILIFKIMNYLKNYDLVHVHLFPALYWVAFAKLFSFSKTQLIFTEHDTFNKRRNNLLFRLLDKFIYKQYSLVITISDAADKNLKAHLNEKIRTKVIYNGIDLKKVNQEADNSFENFIVNTKTKKVLIQIAAFRKQKDQDTLIKSLTYLPKEYVCVFIGDGERRFECENLVNTLNLDDRVFFLGQKDYVGYYISKSDIVVMSSHWEGFGRAAVEGMALMKPVIASDVAGLRDVVGGAGILFNKGDEKDLAFKIKSLIEDPLLYEEYAKSCHKRAQIYDISKMVNLYEQVYKEFECQ